MFQISTGICKKPTISVAEDKVGYANNFYWILDGATPPYGKLKHEHTHFYVNCLDEGLVLNSHLVNTSQELLYNAITYAKNKYEANVTDLTYYPSSTAIILKLGSEVDYSILGDSYLAIESSNRMVVLSDQRLKSIATNERKRVRELNSRVSSESDSEYIDARNKLIQEEQKHKNIKGGYWIASNNSKAAFHAITGNISIDTSDCIIIMTTDGLERLVSVFEEYDDLIKLGKDIIQHGDNYVFSKLRKLESHSSNFKKQISSTHDDASYLLIHSTRNE